MNWGGMRLATRFNEHGAWRLRLLPWRRIVPSPHTGGGQTDHQPERVHDGVHALPAGGVAGDASDGIRVSVHGLPDHRHGRGEPGNVRRLYVPGRGGAYGGADHASGTGVDTGHRVAAISRGVWTPTSKRLASRSIPSTRMTPRSKMNQPA